MKDRGNQNCPLCEKPSSYVLKDYWQTKMILCPTCKAFSFPEQKEDFICSSDPDLKLQLSNISGGLSPDMLLQISIEGSEGNEKISHDIVPRSNLC